jgi:hypothetical protein
MIDTRFIRRDRDSKRGHAQYACQSQDLVVILRQHSISVRASGVSRLDGYILQLVIELLPSKFISVDGKRLLRISKQSQFGITVPYIPLSDGAALAPHPHVINPRPKQPII